MAKKVSVIIPVWNQEDLICRAIESIPVRDDIEIIVIDDGSTDNTWRYISTLYDREDRIRLYKNDKNLGVGYTVNRGYDLAEGEYVVLLGSDDFFYSEEFEKIMSYLDGTDLVYFNLQIKNGDIWHINDNNKNGYVGSVKFMRRKFIGNTRCPKVRSGEDWFFFKELQSKNPTEKFTDITLKFYNFPRQNSLTDLRRRGLIDGE